MFVGLVTSLMISLGGGLSIKAAEKVEVQFEDMSIPISVKELVDWVEGISIPNSLRELSEWARNGGKDSELASWLNLLDLESKAGLAKILKAPLIKDQSMARQILRSWVGRQLLDDVSDLIRVDEDTSGKKVFTTLENLLESQPTVNTLDLLEALPGESIKLDLDAFLQVANRWQIELQNQENLVSQLGDLPTTKTISPQLKALSDDFPEPSSRAQSLQVDHRLKPLRIEVWRPSEKIASKASWIVFMPGLGGTPDHFRWLARSLSKRGWPVVLLEHPGSDAKAMQELLEGKSPAPGAEVLPDRLSDLYSVIRAKEQGQVVLSEKKLVLMGHSLGALTSFLAAGAKPEPGLEKRCETALEALSLTNLSQLLQCQIRNVLFPDELEINQLEAIVAMNSFGSLLWPSIGGTKISLPVYLTGGTYDLITPAITEQLGLLISTLPNRLSRTLLIEGASHFSPIRVEGQLPKSSGEDLFQLGEAFVGVQPLGVQDLLATQIIKFLESIEAKKPLELLLNKKKDGLSFYLIDRENVENLLDN